MFRILKICNSLLTLVTRYIMCSVPQNAIAANEIEAWRLSGPPLAYSLPERVNPHHKIVAALVLYAIRQTKEAKGRNLANSPNSVEQGWGVRKPRRTEFFRRNPCYPPVQWAKPGLVVGFSC
jgi:hypothetical protein